MSSFLFYAFIMEEKSGERAEKNRKGYLHSRNLGLFLDKDGRKDYNELCSC